MLGRHFGGAPVLRPKLRLDAQNLADYVMTACVPATSADTHGSVGSGATSRTSCIAPRWERCFYMEGRNQRSRTASASSVGTSRPPAGFGASIPGPATRRVTY